MRTRWAALGASSLLGGLAGCGSPPPPEAPAETCDVQILNVSVMADCINPAANGMARPVQLRIYQLKSDVKLLNAEFRDVWKADADTLGDDLVSVEEMPIYPRTIEDAKFERSEEAKFIAAAAMYREPKGRSWFTVFELPPSPADGACGLIECDGDDCEDAPVYDPKFAFWLDESRVEDGAGYVDFDPAGPDQCIEGARRRDAALQPPPASGFAASQEKKEEGSSGSDLPDIPSGSDVPSAPEAPQAPQAPTAPDLP